MSRWIVFLFLQLVCRLAVVAQYESDSLRTHYIQEYPDRFMLWPVLKQRQLSFSVRDIGRKRERINFYPNNAFSLGVGAYLFEVVAEVTFSIPLNEKRKEIYGESAVRDMQANIMTRKFAADIYYQRYSGFYRVDKRVAIPAGSPYPQRADISTRNIGLGGLYVFNHRKFSLRSAFNYVDRQLNSGGSFLVGGTLNSFILKADSAIVPVEPNASIGEGGAFNRLRNTTLNIGAGYSYTLIWRKLLVNGTITAGPAQHWIQFEEQGVKHHAIVINGIASLQFGLGYNSDRFFCGAGFRTQSRNAAFSAVRFSNTSSIFRMVVGYRFREIGVLKKRAVDLISTGF
jgi:hypothetical protein